MRGTILTGSLFVALLFAGSASAQTSDSEDQGICVETSTGPITLEKGSIYTKRTTVSTAAAMLPGATECPATKPFDSTPLPKTVIPPFGPKEITETVVIKTQSSDIPKNLLGFFLKLTGAAKRTEYDKTIISSAKCVIEGKSTVELPCDVTRHWYFVETVTVENETYTSSGKIYLRNIETTTVGETYSDFNVKTQTYDGCKVRKRTKSQQLGCQTNYCVPPEQCLA
ncbi:MAG: hypothetical protein SFU56_01175 [Capsulimonadales bacterium]|nr:hypothetical protein [Capsulimonadales bacterium]